MENTVCPYYIFCFDFNRHLLLHWPVFYGESFSRTIFTPTAKEGKDRGEKESSVEIVQSPPNIAASNEGGEGGGGNGRVCFGRIQGGSPKNKSFIV